MTFSGFGTVRNGIANNVLYRYVWAVSAYHFSYPVFLRLENTGMNLLVPSNKRR